MRRRLRKKLIALMRDEPPRPEHAIARRYAALFAATLAAPAVVPEDVVRHGLARVHAWPKALRPLPDVLHAVALCAVKMATAPLMVEAS